MRRRKAREDGELPSRHQLLPALKPDATARRFRRRCRRRHRRPRRSGRGQHPRHRPLPRLRWGDRRRGQDWTISSSRARRGERPLRLALLLLLLLLLALALELAAAAEACLLLSRPQPRRGGLALPVPEHTVDAGQGREVGGANVREELGQVHFGRGWFFIFSLFLDFF